MKIPGLKKNAQERVDAALKRARNTGTKFAKGGVGSAYSAGTGAACFYIAKMATEKDAKTGKARVEFLANQPYAVPALMAVAGHMVKRKQADVGAAMLGAAGLLAAQAYTAPKSSAAGGGSNALSAEELQKQLGGATGYGYGGAYGAGMYHPAMGAGAVIMPTLGTAYGAGHYHPSYGEAYSPMGEAGAVIQPASASSFLSLSDV